MVARRRAVAAALFAVAGAMSLVIGLQSESYSKIAMGILGLFLAVLNWSLFRRPEG